MKKDEVNIHDRIFQWVLSCLEVARKIPNDSLGYVIKHQFVKSCTSSGANDQEANNSSSRSDFESKYGIVKKELAESIYWLKIIDSQYPVINVSSQIAEAKELLNIISSIILSSKRQAK